MEINLSIIQRVGAELNNNYVETLIMIWKLNHSFHFRTLPHIRWRPQPGDWDTNSERSFSTLWGNIVSIAVTSVLQFWHQCTTAQRTDFHNTLKCAYSCLLLLLKAHHAITCFQNSKLFTIMGIKISPPDIMTLVFWS